MDRWLPGFIHGEGTFKFTSVDLQGLLEQLFVEVREGDVYKGSWNNNLPHGQGLLACTGGATYEGGFLKGALSGKGIYRSGSGLDHDHTWGWDWMGILLRAHHWATPSSSWQNFHPRIRGRVLRRPLSWTWDSQI